MEFMHKREQANGPSCLKRNPDSRAHISCSKSGDPYDYVHDVNFLCWVHPRCDLAALFCSFYRYCLLADIQLKTLANLSMPGPSFVKFHSREMAHWLYICVLYKHSTLAQQTLVEQSWKTARRIEGVRLGVWKGTTRKSPPEREVAGQVSFERHRPHVTVSANKH